MHSQNIHLKLSAEMLEKIDLAAKDTFQSRSAFIRESIALRLNGQYVTQIQVNEQQLDEKLMYFLPDGHPLKQ